MSKTLYKGLTIVLLIFIFSNSLLSADVSSAQSGFFVSIVLSILDWFHINIDMDTLSLIIRKIAHFLEFFALGFSIAKGWGMKFFIHLSIILLIASLDESIQLFSNGRAFSVIDIGIDTCGGITGWMLSRRLSK